MRVVLCGYYGKGNGGDEALLATLLQMLPSHVTPVVLSGDPAQTTADYGVEACDRNSSWAILHALRTADGFMFGGGSLIQDATSALSPFYYAGLMGLAHGFRLQTLAWGQGVGPLQRPLTRWLARLLFRSCAAVSVRDRGSAQLLQSWDVATLLAPDPVWALEAKPLPDLMTSEFGATVGLAQPWSTPPQAQTPRIAISLRPAPSLTPARLDALIAAIALLQSQTHATVLLVPFQPSQDRAIAERLYRELSGPRTILELRDPRQLKGLFRQVDLAISMRLHGLIMAASEGCPCFALSYDPKVSQLMADVGLSGVELDTMEPDMEPDVESLAQSWQTLLTQPSGLSLSQIADLRDRALDHQDLLEDCLKP